MNQQVFERNWGEIKSRVSQRWRQLSAEELDAFTGNIEQLVGMIQQKTGEARERIEGFLEGVEADLSSRFDATAESYREALDQITRRLKQRYTEAENMVHQRPLESVAAGFGVGILTGIVVGLVLRSR